MKNLMKSTLVAVVLGFCSTSLFASNYAVQDTVTKDTLKEETTVCLAIDEVTYSKVKVSDVPQAVKTAVESTYTAYTIEEAYKGSDGMYKLVLKNEEAKLTVYYTESGEFKKEENCAKMQEV